ncbi:DUF2169 domain-containing protein [Archangium sp.]|uniref:DUF2169 family type VI secretion system accessory protein n=1 Tax=Archangium sp. TaxID=1872627 RepID=UPI002D43304C|nr:DUF2169 domain-containing protein [Archangium sp.]HYO54577.1 DUF2169 domain-containing protein [Archangium sp.]
MWMIDNRTAYAAERTWVRDKTGAHHWIVAVRATFAIGERGALSVADEQVPPREVAEYSGEAGKSSLKYEADLGPMKPGTDLTVLGSAYTPHGRPATNVIAGFRIGNVRKAIQVFGERVYFPGLLGVGISRPVPFIKQPIRYEAAYGGTDTSDPNPARHVRDGRNPIGCGVAKNARTLVDQQAHTLEYPGTDPAKAGPAGFGPIASYWSPRREYAGTYDERWKKHRKPLLPDDYDERFALCAPRDQQFHRYLRGGELLELANLTPAGVLRVTLPDITLLFATRINGRTEQHVGQLVSVIVEPDDGRLSLVYQSSLAVRAHEADYLDVTRVSEA